jgi:hypothetical protein
MLANIPTWMIFDDHEVSNCWYVSRVWSDRARASPLGRAIIRNGLLSYGLFQGWGNDPVAFESGPGAELLRLATELFPPGVDGPDETALAALDGLLGLDGNDLPMRWHYSVSGPKHRVFVLDSRTRRGFASPYSPPALVPAATLEQQIPTGPPPAGIEVTFVVAPAPVLGLRLMEDLVQGISLRV